LRAAGLGAEYSLVTPSQLPQAVSAQSPDSQLVVVDAEPWLDWELLSFVRQYAANAVFVLWTSQITSQLAHAATDAGIHGLLSTKLTLEAAAEELLRICHGERSCAGVVADGAGNDRCVDLTPRESQVVDMVIEGMKNKEIAARLHTSEGSVKLHLNRIFRKMRVSSRYELMVAAHEASCQREPLPRETAASYAGAPFDEWWMLSAGAEVA
jgi:DNA-binding NarL/FixJ family response regulator